MKIHLLFLVVCLPVCALMAQSIGIGTASPHTSAQLDVSSTTRGLLAPRLTTAQRTAIAAPAKGLLVYDTDMNALYHYNGSAWAAVGSGGGGFALPYEGSVNTGVPGIKVTNAGAGPAIQAITTNEFGYALQGSNTTNYGYSVYAYSRSPNAIGVYAFVDSSTGVRAASAKGIGVHATSTDSIAVRAAISNGSNADPVILATHAGTGISVRGESNNGVGILGYSNNNTGVSAGTLDGTALLASAIGGTALKGSSSSGYGLDVSGKVKIAGGNTNPSAGSVLTSVDANGNAVWKRGRIGFSVKGINDNVFSLPAKTNNTIHLFTEEYDYGNNYAAFSGTTPTFGNSVFVAPVTGLYHFDAYLALHEPDYEAYVQYPELRLVIIRGNRIIAAAVEFSPLVRLDASAYIVKAELSKDVRLINGDIVFLEVYHNSGVPVSLWQYGPDPFFNGHLVFAE